jgi:hypothetical protein
MKEHAVTISIPHMIHLNVESPNAMLIADIEKAVEQILKEHYPKIGGDLV